MKRNNIDTAPTYTNIYDKPIKLYPININIPAIFTNKPIKNNTDNYWISTYYSIIYLIIYR